RRRIKSGAIAARAKHAFEQRGGGPFAFGARDVNGRKFLVGIVETREDGAHAVEFTRVLTRRMRVQARKRIVPFYGVSVSGIHDVILASLRQNAYWIDAR